MTTTAIPLCLPNNCQWNENTNKCSTLHDVKRSHLHTIDAALRKLRTIYGPVCVVAVTGPCRKGKSYILSKAFDDREIFPLGHLMDPETMGLWLWVVKETFYDSNGDAFTVVLLDSEGTDSVLSKKRDDDVIFTLTVLLSSVLIYNSTGVPTRRDLEELDHVIKISQRIQVFSGKKTEATHAQLVFPSFIWLLRDVLQEVPSHYKTLQDYFLKQVFKVDKTSSSSDDKAQQATDSILKCFPSFDAFSLPPPAYDPKVIQSLNDRGSQGKINSVFLSEIEGFKAILHARLDPKRTPDGKGFVTGEALAAMVETYVKVINTPGAVPSVADAWDTYIGSKASETLKSAKIIYNGQMRDYLEHLVPCDADMIREIHKLALDQALEFFNNETIWIAVEKVWDFKRELLIEAEETESDWLMENNSLTEEFCSKLFIRLKDEILDPVRRFWIRAAEQEEMAFAVSCIESAYDELMNEFKRKYQGCKELFKNIAVLKEEELEGEKREDIRRVERLCYHRDELAAYKVANMEEEDEAKRIGAENTEIKARIRKIQIEKMELELKKEFDNVALEERMAEDLRRQREEFADVMKNEQEKAKLEHEGQRTMARIRKEELDRLKEVIREREQALKDLKARKDRL